MALLVGRFVNKIDKKGRVSVPKPFRDAFKDQAFAGLYAYPLFKFPAIEACGEDFMARISASLDDLDMFSDEQDELASVIMENAHPLTFDPEGRVVLPPELLEHAGIAEQALFVGRGTRLQIWSPDTYASHAKQTFERARSRGATLKLRPQGPAAPEG
jgi:MraZ protein